LGALAGLNERAARSRQKKHEEAAAEGELNAKCRQTWKVETICEMTDGVYIPPATRLREFFFFSPNLKQILNLTRV
jgi:hypothetical protein